ncbi:Protein kinase dsk1 [Smittium culicis]|uniref:non-specific serine/threonine protein kinase n=1 Tax=Smittium culicis TaxID=133412 RepID=A0A1R1X0J4_9FUNG|nr:Protein kinase dsk1 [Smittium culicis]
MQTAKRRALEKKLKKFQAARNSQKNVDNSNNRSPSPMEDIKVADSPARYSDESDSQYTNSEPEEDIEDYKIGGYHPVKIGERFKNNRYKVVRKLGWGHFSTVWLAYDSSSDRHVALKIVKSAKRYYEAATDEIKLCSRAATSSTSHTGHKYIVLLLDNFEISGPNGIHIVMVFEVLGENLLYLLKKAKRFHSIESSRSLADSSERNQDYNRKLSNASSSSFERNSGSNNSFKGNGLPISIVKQISKQVLHGLAYLHGPCRMIHTDLKPENVLVCIDNVEQVIRSQLDDSSTASPKHVPEQEPSSDFAFGLMLDNNSSINNSTTATNFKFGNASISTSLERNMNDINISEPQSIQQSENSTTGSTNTNVEIIDSETKDSDGSKSNSNTDDNSNTLTKDAHNDVPYKINVKIADLGNATWIEEHFTNDIQTRQYRSPEVIIGAEWNSSADIWSCACLIFEMLTGEYLFEPRNGKNYEKDEDHLAQIIEIISPLSKKFAISGRLRPFPLNELLNKEYGFSRSESLEIADFLRPMLDVNPLRRATANEMLKHPWIN